MSKYVMIGAIANFMQKEDRNGFWNESLEETLKDGNDNQLSEYEMDVYHTLIDWCEDGLEINGKIHGYLQYLQRNIHPSNRAYQFIDPQITNNDN